MPTPYRQRILLALRILAGKPLSITATNNSSTNLDIPAITQDEIAEARAFFPRDKFFIFGHARSGTTVLARLVRLHPDVHCNYQAHFFTRPPLLQALVQDEQVQSWLSRSSNRWNRGSNLSAVILRAAADFILEREARQQGKSIVGDKSPNSLMDGEAVRLMHKVYPDARLVYIVRDGRDAAVSHRFQAFIDFPQQLTKEDLRIRDDFARDANAFTNGGRSIFTERAIRSAAEGWVRNLEQTDQIGRQLYGDRYYVLRYEDLLAHPWDETQRLWAFLGASQAGEQEQAAVEAEMARNPDAEWQQEKAGDIAQSLQKGKRGTWQEYFTARDRQIFHQIAGEALRAWGYDDVA